MATREPVYKMTFLKITSSSKLISCKMWDLEQKTKENTFFRRIFFQQWKINFWEKNLIF